MNNSIERYINAMFNSYYDESRAYAAGIIDKETAADNFDKQGENILNELSIWLNELNLSSDHLETVRAIKARLLRAIEELP